VAKRKVLVTGASGYVASLMLPGFREKYDLVLLDSRKEDRTGKAVPGIEVVDLIDPDRKKYAKYFEGVDAVVHLAHKIQRTDPIDHFFSEKQNVEMAYNIFRTSYDAGVRRVVMASSNHAADWYEHNMVHTRKKEVVDPYDYPLSDNFYGWAKATYEHMGFLFANGFPNFSHPSGRELLVEGANAGRKLGVIMVRIGHPRELEFKNYGSDEATFKRVLGCYFSARDATQIFMKSIETENIDNEHGIPFHVVYGISNNTRAFWSLANARKVLGYAPEDDAEVKFAHLVREHITGNPKSGVGRVGLK